MSEIEDYTKANQIVPVEDWLERCGLLKPGLVLVTKLELVKILKAYRAYIYEAEVRPDIQFHGQEMDIGQIEEP